jgi:hypothetical protein
LIQLHCLFHINDTIEFKSVLLLPGIADPVQEGKPSRKAFHHTKKGEDA